MKISICTISFRHQLVSIDQLVHWAKSHHFDGIELWGVHGRNLLQQSHYNGDWLAENGLRTTMISDYLPVHGSEQEAYYQVQQLCRLARHWGAEKIRTFAGHTASSKTTTNERQRISARLRQICDWVAEHDLRLVVEIHPNTLADTIESTLRLLADVKHPKLKINFDVLHVWESWADPIESLDRLEGHIDHFHLKNISNRECLEVFNPPNVYAAAGNREGMVPLFEGAVDYEAFLSYLYNHPTTNWLNADASLEWFGNNVKQVLNQDRYRIQKQLQGRLIARR